jgi:hypothetical protein
MAVTFTRNGPLGIAEVSNPPVNAINRAVRTGLAELAILEGRDWRLH